METGSRNSSWTCSRTPPRQPRCGQTGCGYRALFAAALLEVLRQCGLAGTELATAQFGTIRALLKVAAVVRVSVRRIWVSLFSVFPCQELFAHSLSRLREVALG